MVHKCTSVVSAGLVSDSAESRRPAAQLSRPSFPGPGRRSASLGRIPPDRRHSVGGWGGRDRTYECRNQNPVPYHLATPQ